MKLNVSFKRLSLTGDLEHAHRCAAVRCGALRRDAAGCGALR